MQFGIAVNILDAFLKQVVSGAAASYTICILMKALKKAAGEMHTVSMQCHILKRIVLNILKLVLFDI